MKYHTLYITICMLLLSALLLAQNRPSIEQRVENLGEQLSLNEQQAAQLEGILKAGEAEMQRIREENKDNREAARAALQDMRTNQNQQIMNILDEDQQKKYQELQANRSERGRGGPGSDAIVELQDRLNLSDYQTDQIAGIMAEGRDKMSELRENGGNRRAMRTEMRKILEKQDEKILALLEDDQKEEYEKIRDERQKEMRQQMRRGGRQRR